MKSIKVHRNLVALKYNDAIDPQIHIRLRVWSRQILGYYRTKGYRR